jgi:hypothetical protein
MSKGEEVTQIKEEWQWPFSLSDLTAGLRRHLGDTSVQVVRIIPQTMPYKRPAIGRVRAVKVEYQAESGDGSCQIVVKEPQGTTRTGLAGAGRRETGVYRSLASQFPMPTPALIASSPVGDWLLLEAFHSVRDPKNWSVKDYRLAIESLTHLHDRFWELDVDLSAFPWLSRPLGADFEVHVTAAAKAIERIVQLGQPEPLVGAPERMRVLAALTMKADQIIHPLLHQPSTLLHGDYWPGNIAVLEDGRQMVYDWQLAAVGPGVIDLVVFVSKSAWWFDTIPLSQSDMVICYREEIQRRNQVSWRDDEWEVLWDHALMWRFLQEWVDLLAASPNPLLETRAEQLDQVWLDPVAEAVARRLEAV